MKRRLAENLRVIPRIMEMTIRGTLTDGFIIFTVLIQPLLVAILGIWMLKGKGSDYAIYVVVGSGMTGLWSSLLFLSGNSISIERWTGTLESLVGVPTPLSVIVIGKNLMNVLQSLVSMVVTYVLASFIFGYALTLTQPLLFAGSLVLTVVSFISFGMILAPIFVLNPAIQQFQNGLEFPVYLLSGFLFPIALLPGWITPLSYILPPYWAARALHASSSGHGASDVLLSWGMMLLFSVVYLAVSGVLFRAVLTKARRDATLDMQ